MHNIFDGEAKRFYSDQVYENLFTYEDEKSKMIFQYNRAKTQNHMRQYLQNLNLNSILEKENCDITAGIENLRDAINKYTPLGPPSHRSNSSKIKYMYEAIVGYQ